MPSKTFTKTISLKPATDQTVEKKHQVLKDP